MTPSQSFISDHYIEHYDQRHPALSSTGEVELINTYVPKRCPFCGCEKFIRYGHTRIGVQRYKCSKPECSQTFLPTTGTIFDEHRISISEWIEYCLNLFRNVSVNADSWNNKNAFSTSRYWMEKLFLILDTYQDVIIVRKKVWLDETYYSVMLKDAVLNEDGTQYPGTTDIHSIDNGELAIDNYYTLDGRKLQVMPTVKGVYIVNGKKVVIK
jgi:transposase-like protein